MSGVRGGIACLWLVTATAGAHAAEGLEEVIVTATRRAVDVQRVPAAISVVSAATIDDLSMSTIDDVAAQVPGVVVSRGSNTTPWVFIRGVGMNDINANSVGSVGLYFDDVYLSNTAAQMFPLFDLERVEVLKGPQGTLYGRNTTGGVLRMVPVNPAPEPGGYARVSYGRHEQFDFEGAGNVPLNELWSARLAGVRHTREPIFENTNGTGDASDVDTWAARGSLRYRSDAQDWVLGLYGARYDALAPARDISLIAEHPDRADIGKPRSGALGWPGWDKADIRGATLNGTADLGSVELASVTGWLESERNSGVDLDFSPPEWFSETRWNEATQFSQELRIASTGSSSLDWTTGLYAFREDLDATVQFRADQAFGNPAVTFDSYAVYAQQTTSAAAFGHVAWHLTDRLSLLAGARYTCEEKHFRTEQEGYFGAPYEAAQQEARWCRPSGEVGASVSWTPDTMAYARISSGFRAGGFNAGGGVDDPRFEPEYVDQYEIGLKTVLAQDRLRVGAAVFHSDYRDMQVFALVTGLDGVLTQYLTNAARSSIDGLEVELGWRPLADLHLDLSGAWLDARFDEYIDGADIDRSGNRLVGAPRTSLSALARYEPALARGGHLQFIVDASYRDEFYFNSANTARFASPSRTLLGARVGYAGPEDRYRVSLWGRNLTDELYYSRATSFLAIDAILVGEPRSYGVEVELNF